MSYESTLNSLKKQIEAAIKEWLPQISTPPEELHQAINYSSTVGGKRFRPILLIAAYNLFPKSLDPIPAAVALECIHTSSLIHDDLPCMDDSDLRRGHPTCHKQFNEALAVLAGDALLIYPFEILSKAYSTEPIVALKLINILSKASGSQKLIGGQVMDMQVQKLDRTLESLNTINRNKTAALLSASLMMGGVLAGLSEKKVGQLEELGEALGLAFQIVDDILDATSSDDVLGKAAGQDEKNDKLTYPSVCGLDESYKQADIYTQKALKLCEELGGDNVFLKELIKGLLVRVS